MLGPLFGNGARQQASSNEPQSFPDFVLPAASGGSVRLTEKTNSYTTVILVFHRGLECIACQTQLAELQSGYEDLLAEGAEVLSIGPDDQFDTQRLAQRMGLRFPMLYDESGAVSSQYGVRDQLMNDFSTAILILDSKRQLLTNAVGTSTDQVLPVQVIINAIRQANGSAGTGGTAS